MTENVPFQLARHMPLVDVTVDNRFSGKFIVDTGMGINVVSDAVLKELGHPPTGTNHTGRRMTGQEITIPLSQVNELALGRVRQLHPVVGSFDFSRLPIGEMPLRGFLSLAFFEDTPVTFDFSGQRLCLEGEPTAAPRSDWGEAIAVEVARHGPQVEVFLELELPSGRRIKVEVDTGSDRLILHRRFMQELGIAPGSAGVEEQHGSDDFGRPFVRYLARLPGAVRVASATSFAQESPDAVFLDIIYDGIVGFEFLRLFRTTFDLANSCLFFAPKS